MVTELAYFVKFLKRVMCFTTFMVGILGSIPKLWNNAYRFSVKLSSVDSTEYIVPYVWYNPLSGAKISWCVEPKSIISHKEHVT